MHIFHFFVAKNLWSPEIHDFEDIPLGKDDILRFQVSMYNLFVVKVSDSLQNLFHNYWCFLFTEMMFFPDFIE